MKASLSGSTGFVGNALLVKLLEQGWDVKVIGREAFNKSDQEFREQFIEGSDAVINMAGAPVSQKWTVSWKKEIMDSRVLTTRKIASAIAGAEQKPRVFISSSAVGIYDTAGTHDEGSTAYDRSFLAEVCKAWELEAQAAGGDTRLVILRTGVVLGSGGGALAKMHLPFSIGLGGRTGSGTQPVSFIHLADLIGAILFILDNQSVSGVVNAVSPFPTTNAEFTDKLAKVLGQPGWLPTPAFVLKMMYGEGAKVLLEGQNVLPAKLERAGFRFRFPTIQNALMDIYG